MHLVAFGALCVGSVFAQSNSAAGLWLTQRDSRSCCKCNCPLVASLHSAEYTPDRKILLFKKTETSQNNNLFCQRLQEHKALLYKVGSSETLSLRVSCWWQMTMLYSTPIITQETDKQLCNLWRCDLLLFILACQIQAAPETHLHRLPSCSSVFGNIDQEMVEAPCQIQTAPETHLHRLPSCSCVLQKVSFPGNVFIDCWKAWTFLSLFLLCVCCLPCGSSAGDSTEQLEKSSECWIAWSKSFNAGFWPKKQMVCFVWVCLLPVAEKLHTWLKFGVLAGRQAAQYLEH